MERLLWKRKPFILERKPCVMNNRIIYSCPHNALQAHELRRCKNRINSICRPTFTVLNAKQKKNEREYEKSAEKSPNRRRFIPNLLFTWCANASYINDIECFCPARTHFHPCAVYPLSNAARSFLVSISVVCIHTFFALVSRVRIFFSSVQLFQPLKNDSIRKYCVFAQIIIC